MPRVSSYRNQSTDLQGKSVDWFLFIFNFVLSWIYMNFRRVHYKKGNAKNKYWLNGKESAKVK